ncbi:HAD family phosphatase [Epilithonimonas ginsengisoli]|uniref:HAD family phosphatase n=1 Tax=Epilithonimonas ginsengisoli TaxID=1245592 RepID=A0ABU4JIU7_9FLAO|nr:MULTISPECIES: HAD family phosphatase [Chryseobacterium group]MBV6880824.1 HAD family phosphatase [Epilithonimonas sp. FP105]MDW8549606.1 HAD family phosphatase [Epilithonimonas ginsengisoli]OAH76735.1 HAD family hydrolase [Chryseobacterium sp. FP211-J200]
MKIKNIIFDFGGVVMDWDPRYYFKTYFNDDEKMEFFLKNIAVDEWNIEQDRGRTLKDGTEILVKQHPEWEKEIRAYYDNWTTMLKSDIPKNVEVLRKLEGKFHLYGLTNWSEETFPFALENYDFFKIFEGKIVVSGTEKLIKPDKEIFEVLLSRYDLKAEESVFIDDNAKNIATAKSLGFITIHIKPETDLGEELKNLGINF